MVRASTFLLACAALAQFANAFAAPINITLTDKRGNPRANLAVRYDVDGIIVDNRRASPVRLLANQPATTNVKTGQFTIQTAAIVAQLTANATTLLNSEQVTITIRPVGDSTLVEVELKLLLGSVAQDLNIVMMKLPAYRTEQLARAVYIGPKGTFHLAGFTGTAFYSTHAHNRWLTALEHDETQNSFLIYREVDAPQRLWAFARRCTVSATCAHHRRCHIREPLCTVWVWNETQKKWRRYDFAKRIVPINANLFTANPIAAERYMTGASKGRPYRTWKSAGGDTAVAQLIDLNSRTGIARMQLKSGRVVSASFYDLTVEDQNYILNELTPQVTEQ